MDGDYGTPEPIVSWYWHWPVRSPDETAQERRERVEGRLSLCRGQTDWDGERRSYIRQRVVAVAVLYPTDPDRHWTGTYLPDAKTLALYEGSGLRGGAATRDAWKRRIQKVWTGQVYGTRGVW